MPSSLEAALQRVHNFVQDSVVQSTLRNIILILTWYVLSTSLSLYNKLLVGKKHGLFGRGAFPAPLLMSAIQFLCQYLIVRLVFALNLHARAERQQPLSWPAYAKQVLPNGIVTGLDIGISNKSLAFITISFYTMCKSTTPIFLLIFAFIWRIERPSWTLAGVVCCICTGLVLLVEGETEFDVNGFALVMTASSFSGLRFTLTQLLLHGTQGKVALGGPLDLLELLTPVMALTVFLLSALWERLWGLGASPYFESIQHSLITLSVIAVGACIAFLMVWAEYQVIKETSALTFMIAGVVKEVVTIIAAIIIMGDRISFINGVGLGVVILGVVAFNMVKYQRVRSGEVPAHPGLVKGHGRRGLGGLEAEGVGGDPASGAASPTGLRTPRCAGGRSPDPLLGAGGGGGAHSAGDGESVELVPLLPISGAMVHR